MSTKYEQVETGIYRYVIPARPGKNGKKTKAIVTYHERPTINGERTFRSLGVNFTRQTSLKNGREEYQRRRTEIAAGRDPYAGQVAKTPEVKVLTGGDVIARYELDSYPDKHKCKRTGRTLDDEISHCEKLKPFWSDVPVDKSGPGACDRYHTFRCAQGFRMGSGARTVDRELNTLNNAFRWAVRCELLKSNPLAERPHYQKSTDVKHCREFMPRDAEELHDAAREFFKHPHSVVLGFQLLSEAYSSLRTQEVLKWGVDIFGSATSDGKNINVWRCKGQHSVSPFVTVNEGMAALRKAHADWKAVNYPDASEFFPSHCGGSVSKGALVRALGRLFKSGMIKRKLTSHGAGRAFYVLVRRSHGISDAQIASELGHTSGGACITSTYGGVPDAWRKGDGPRLSWLPAVPAWDALEKADWKFTCPADKKHGQKTPTQNVNSGPLAGSKPTDKQ